MQYQCKLSKSKPRAPVSERNFGRPPLLTTRRSPCDAQLDLKKVSLQLIPQTLPKVRRKQSTLGHRRRAAPPRPTPRLRRPSGTGGNRRPRVRPAGNQTLPSPCRNNFTRHGSAPRSGGNKCRTNMFFCAGVQCRVPSIGASARLRVRGEGRSVDGNVGLSLLAHSARFSAKSQTPSPIANIFELLARTLSAWKRDVRRTISLTSL